MKAQSEVEAGVCGFKATIVAESHDGQMVMLDIRTDCEKNQRFAAALRGEQIDAFREIDPSSEGRIMTETRSLLRGCCAACVIPVAAFKTMQVAAGLALPQDVVIRVSKE